MKIILERIYGLYPWPALALKYALRLTTGLGLGGQAPPRHYAERRGSHPRPPAVRQPLDSDAGRSESNRAQREVTLEAFKDKLNKNRALLEQRIKLSWSNWGFGLEPLATTARRLSRNGIEWIELHGNRYGQRGTVTRNRVSLKFLVEHEFQQHEHGRNQCIRNYFRQIYKKRNGWNSQRKVLRDMPAV